MKGRSTSCLGLGKTLFNSSACVFRPGGAPGEQRPRIELALSERLLRKKAAGTWPEAAIGALGLGDEPLAIAENRDVLSPAEQERALDRSFPFFDHLKRAGLARFSSRFNPELEFVTHHRCHAMAAVAMSPFEKCVIVVMDGAGSLRRDFSETQARDEGIAEHSVSPDSHEECSVYLHDRGRLRGVRKRWRVFRRGVRATEHTFSEGSGILYEKVAEYVFNSGRAAGKVMGLASFGSPSAAIPNGGRWDFVDGLDWSRAFQGGSKKDWEESGRFAEFANLAASAQQDFEAGYFELLREIRSAYPGYDRLILTGGCALNCTANGKLLATGLFNEVYVPPFPGDESIGLGAASWLYYIKEGYPWLPLPPSEQHGYFGPRSSVPSEGEVDRVFAGLEIRKPPSITRYVAGLLAEGKILGWYQGRSESGPRALGNRSILADPRVAGLKDRLNREVKFREAFRPYGASCTFESVRTWFDVPAAFDSPFMSFAVRPRPEQRELLKEVCHVDGTSRIQTVRPGQNPLFHELLTEFGAMTGLPCLLNTSLNVMGEPIVESMADARAFLEKTPVDGIAVGEHFVRRRSS
ncbi:MAG TPA: carbamoyltransferase C-terminal domain-containing protein [Bdellovibrionota bacterium]|nr:carbamoyltransferase C-terminal domain-containing protein [Bdellovibrionota bacterium]